MGQVIEFRAARLQSAIEGRCRCGICGADLWHISKSGEVCCADCDTVCPYRLQEGFASGKRQAECGLSGAAPTGDID